MKAHPVPSPERGNSPWATPTILAAHAPVGHASGVPGTSVPRVFMGGLGSSGTLSILDPSNPADPARLFQGK